MLDIIIPSHIKQKIRILQYVHRLSKELKINRLRNREITIRFKNVMDDDAWGYCIGDFWDVEIQINRTITFEDQMQTLAHEMVHTKQFLRGELDGTSWKKRNYDYTKYEDQPWEKEANKLEKKLYKRCFI